MTSRTLVWAFLVSYLTASSISPFIVKFIQKREARQIVREDGPKAHKSKSGTPTMGGFIFIIATCVAVLITKNFSEQVGFILLSFVGFAFIGFADDHLKVIMKRNEGLTASQKIVGQLIVASFVSYYAYNLFGSELYIPIINKFVDMGFMYIPLLIFVFLAVTNSVNLTDGIDGLATMVTIGVVSFFGMMAIKMELVGVTKLVFSLMGALLAFFAVNKNPAKIFMGDLGSLALGGIVTAFAVSTKMVFMIPLVGIIYFVEALSVIIQVLYFKRTGKRIFRMSPIHHHFELGGWSERMIVSRFSAITLICVFIGYFIVVL